MSVKKVCITILFLVLSINVYSQRNTLLLDGPWSFSIDSTRSGIQNKWFEKGLPGPKETVLVPHTWNTVEKTAKYYGWGWYEKNLTLPSNWKGSNIKLQFDAVFHDASVWVNGRKAGEHTSSGYTKFFIDVTDLVNAGQSNKVVVLSDNSFSAENIPYKHIFDWANDGGIIRSVQLISTQRPRIDYVHVLATPDLKTPHLNGKGSARFKIKLSELDHIDLSKVGINIVITELNQKTNKKVYSTRMKPAVKNSIAEFNVNFDNINRWHFEDPNLYQLSLTVSYKNKPTDQDTVNFGFRSFKTLGDKFVFNGENIRTAGVEWMGGSSLKNGMAENQDEMRTSLEKLKHLNTIFTRFHFQQADYVYDWCDKNGIMVQQEIPIWGAKTVMTDTIKNIAKLQLKEMIENAFSHPSIVAWGVGNEVESRTELNVSGVKELYAYTKSLDSSRLVNYVSNRLQNTNAIKDATSYGDVMMYNDYHSTWYRQAKAGRGPLLDKIQAENRKMPLVISEFGLCEPENWGDDSKRIVEMINNYSVYESKSYIAGVIYFCLNDYRTHMGGGKHDFHSTRVHGVYDLLGNPKPSAAILRELNCPIDVTGLNINKANKIAVTVVGSLGFPSYQLKDYKCYWSANATNYRTTSEMLNLPVINPGKTFDFEVANKFNNKGVLTIENGRGHVVYQKIIDQVGVYN
jgi:beta-glucuronidase